MRRRADKPSNSTQTTGLPRELVWFLLLEISFSVLSISSALARLALHRDPKPLKWLYPHEPGFDFYCYYPRFLHLHSASFFTLPGYPWYYPAPAIFAYSPFFWLIKVTGHYGPGFVAYWLIVAGLGFYCARKLSSALRDRGIASRTANGFVFVTLFLSWPIYFALQRGNIEALTWFIVAAAIWAYFQDRWALAAILLGIAGCIKIYPLLCLALFLRPKKFKELAYGVLAAAASTLLALRFIDTDVVYAFRQIKSGVSALTVQYSQKFYPDIAYDHSIFGIIKALIHNGNPDYARWLKAYLLLAAVAVTGWFFVKVIHLPRINQVLFLICCMVALPTTSFDYTLQVIYIPWALLILHAVEAEQEHLQVRGMLIAMVLMAIVFAPETFLTAQGAMHAGFLKGLCLIGLMCVSSCFPFREPASITP